MRLPKKRESGQALIMALILLALGGLLIVPTLRLTQTSLQYHQLIEGKTLEAYSADSGVELALCRLRNDPDGYKEVRLEENFTLNGTSVNVTAEYIGSNVHRIISTATSANGKSTTIESYSSTTSGLLQNVAVSNGDMQVQESIITSAPVEGEADIFVNGNLQLSDSEVYGDVTYTGDLDMSNSIVTGNLTQGGDPQELPEVDADWWKSLAEEGDTHNGDLEIKDETDYHLGPLYITGQLKIQNSSIIIDGVVYVVENIQVQDSTLTGASVMVSEQLVQLQTGDYYTENIPVIMSVYNDITVQANSKVGAVLYAPNGTILIQDYTELYGSAIGSYVQIQKSLLIYVADVQTSEGVPGSQINVFTYRY